jgi:single-strand DNA-binding protein
MYQSITIIGNLGRDPEMRYMPNGDPVTSFSVATSRQYNDRNGQKVKETTWFRVSVFGKMAENTNQYLHKGSMVLVEGRLRVDPKTGGPTTFTRQDGTVGANF